MPNYLSGDTDDENAEQEEADGDVQYDLAGNPLPRAARPPAAPVLAPGEPPNPPPSPVRANFSRSAPPALSFATLPASWPESAGPVWTPPPGYTFAAGLSLGPAGQSSGQIRIWHTALCGPRRSCRRHCCSDVCAAPSQAEDGSCPRRLQGVHRFRRLVCLRPSCWLENERGGDAGRLSGDGILFV